MFGWTGDWAAISMYCSWYDVPNPHSYNVEQQFFEELLWKLPDATSQELAVLDVVVSKNIPRITELSCGVSVKSWRLVTRELVICWCIVLIHPSCLL